MVDPHTSERWGIDATYTDTSGHTRQAPDWSVEHVLGVLAGDAAPDPGLVGAGPPDDGPRFVRTGTTDLPWLDPHRYGSGPRRLVLEDGSDLGVVQHLPPDLEMGHHRLVADDGAGPDARLVVHPPHCHLPDDLRAWGWSVQVPAIRSRESWGIGDLADVARLGEWSARQGPRPFVLLSPLHPPLPVDDPEPSPYFASSRCFRSPLVLHLPHVPGASDVALDDLIHAGAALNQDRLVDRRAVVALQGEGLRRIWAARSDRLRPAADAAMAADPVLAAYARFCVAVEERGPGWRRWPDDLRRPDGAGWGQVATRRADRVAFHAWVQHEVERQLAAVQQVVDLVHDLAVGSGPDGFDAFYWQDLFVLDGTRVGAPADQFNTQGQDWGLPPLHPWASRAAGYEPFVRMLRSAVANGAGLRVDHILGLFRLFWIPPGAGAADGLYVRQPTSDLLSLVALESMRSGAFVVGEDLGTVPHGVHHAMAEQRMMSYRVLSLGSADVDHLPTDALVSVSTHDLPTLAGFWSGSDLADQQRIGTHPNVEDTLAMRAQLRDRLGVADDAPLQDVVLATHALLASAPCRLAVAQLDDAALVAERPNMPGTTTEWPNWSLALPRPLDDVLAEPLPATVAATLATHVPRPGGTV